MQQSTTPGWYVFAGILLGISGVLSIIWGIAAIGDSKFFTENAKFVFSGLHTWGWITLIVGVIEVLGALSLFGGGGFGRIVGIVAATLSAISALLSLTASPFWALCVFALAVIVIYELAKARPATRAV